MRSSNNPHVPLGPITPTFTHEELELIARALRGYINHHNAITPADKQLKKDMAPLLRRIRDMLP